MENSHIMEKGKNNSSKIKTLDIFEANLGNRYQSTYFQKSIQNFPKFEGKVQCNENIALLIIEKMS